MGAGQEQDPAGLLRPGIRRFRDDLGGQGNKQHQSLPHLLRGPVPPALPAVRQSALHPHVPHIRHRVLAPLLHPGGGGCIVTPQHVLQALHVLHLGVRPGAARRGGGAAGHRGGAAGSLLRHPLTPTSFNTLTHRAAGRLYHMTKCYAEVRGYQLKVA
eukprot:CAMPEP_0170061844 /NCGR_PEP_ID=MMETSP0019_2-20121128/3272_1 /TAXON_ID=98059 /ORGANISM="Dinobryon sp., Strain UTEXLB2267" /LENGTH=157 /DNA_ID=CAMNT_0010267801 /DNA_START=320 /DNA_END=793 /DNA_ORIENTATION=+